MTNEANPEGGGKAPSGSGATGGSSGLRLSDLHDLHVGKAILKQLSFLDLCDHYPKGWSRTELNGQPATEIKELGVFLCQIIGSVSFAAQTWLWSWANESIPPALAHLSEQFVTALENRYGIRNISEGELPVTTLDPLMLIHTVLGLFADASGFIERDIGDGAGASYELFLGVPLLNVTPAPTQRLGQVIGALLDAPSVEDKLKAVFAFVIDCGFTLDVENIVGSDHTYVFRDKIGRVTELSHSIPENEQDTYEISYSVTYADKNIELQDYNRQDPSLV